MGEVTNRNDVMGLALFDRIGDSRAKDERIRTLEAERDELRATVERVRGLRNSAAIGFASETVRWSDVAAALEPQHSGADVGEGGR